MSSLVFFLERVRGEWWYKRDKSTFFLFFVPFLDKISANSRLVQIAFVLFFFFFFGVCVRDGIICLRSWLKSITG